MIEDDLRLPPYDWHTMKEDAVSNALAALRLLLCAQCIEEHVRNTQSISCYCDCHSSSRDEEHWPEHEQLVRAALEESAA